jgi:hypothetical protein
VKSLLSHLRQRQEQHGIQAFQFHHVLRNNELVPAEYPESARSALTVVPITEPLPIPDQKTKNSGKAKTSGKSKSPTKSRSPAKSKSSVKSKSPVKSKTKGPPRSPEEVKPPIKSESPQKLEPNLPSPDLLPHVVGDTVTAPVTPPFRFPTPQIQNAYEQVPQSQYDPLLLATNDATAMPVAPPPLQVNHPAYHPGWAHNAGYLPMAANPPPNLGLLADPRLAMMFQQALSQWGGPQGWAAQQPPAAQPPEPHVSGLHHPVAPPAPNIGGPPAFFVPVQQRDPHPIPLGEPPFSIYQQVGLDQPDQAGPSTSAVQTPRKRKREAIQETPSKKPTRTSNRTPTPRKFIQIE